MHGLPEDLWQKWRRKRRNSLIGFVIIGLFLGIDCSVIFSTLYLYLKDLVKAERPEMWYGLIISLFYVSLSVAGAVWGRWLDHSRRVKFYVTLSLLVQVIGFLSYTIPFSPAYLLVGRTICGVGDPFTSVISGEIFRIYDTESTRPIFLISSVYPLGFLIGPSLNFLFTGIKFNIGKIEINSLNFVGLFMPCLIIVVITLAQYLVHDCSKEFDLKAHMQKIIYESESVPQSRVRVGSHTLITSGSFATSMRSEQSYRYSFAASEEHVRLISTSTQTVPIKQVFKIMVSNKETCLVFVATVVLMYTLFAISALVPLLANDLLKWSLKSLSIMYTAIGISDIVCFLLMATYCKSNKSVYGTCLASIAAHILASSILICIKVLDRNAGRDLSLMIILVPAVTICWTFDSVLIRVIFANMIPSHIQSFSETLRVAFSKGARIGGSFTVAVMLPWLQWWSIVMIVLTVPIFILFVTRWRYFIEPTEISFGSDVFRKASANKLYNSLNKCNENAEL